jgi:hypothetical protein
VFNNIKDKVVRKAHYVKAFWSSFQAGAIANRCIAQGGDCIIDDENEVIIGCDKHAKTIARLAEDNKKDYDAYEESSPNLNVTEFSINWFHAKGYDFADEHTTKLVDGFMNLIFMMGGLPTKLSKRYMTETTPGNTVKVVYEGRLIELELSGCDTTEFLTAAQITVTGGEMVWSGMRHPGYWLYSEYNHWVRQVNPLIEESLTHLEGGSNVVWILDFQ